MHIKGRVVCSLSLWWNESWIWFCEICSSHQPMRKWYRFTTGSIKVKKEETASERAPGRLTLHPFLALALLLVLFLEFRDQPFIHVPRLRQRALLFLLYTRKGGRKTRYTPVTRQTPAISAVATSHKIKDILRCDQMRSRDLFCCLLSTAVRFCIADVKADRSAQEWCELSFCREKSVQFSSGVEGTCVCVCVEKHTDRQQIKHNHVQGHCLWGAYKHPFLFLRWII